MPLTASDKFSTALSIDQNAGFFSESLNNLVGWLDADFEKVVRKVVLDLYSRIVIRTPLRTGRARANWDVSMIPHSQVFSPSRPMVKNFTFEMGMSVYIFNNLAYIEQLEKGSSDQAPTGMVAISLVDFYDHLENELKKLGYVE